MNAADRAPHLSRPQPGINAGPKTASGGKGRERPWDWRPALTRLENETEPNPAMVTLIRYAEALGKKLVVNFE